MSVKLEISEMRTEKYGLKVDDKLVEFVEANALPGIDISSKDFWRGLAGIVNKLGPKNKELLQKRKELKQKIDSWHIEQRNKQFNSSEYKKFLKDIGYLVDEGPDFKIETTNVDDEIASIAGPQLVVPITNSRFALNAANARYGSLYDCVYGTDVLGSTSQSKSYDPARGAEVIAYSKNFLDETFPISGLSHADATNYWVEEGELLIDGKKLKNPSQFVGYRDETKSPEGVLLKNNGLHVELYFNRETPIGQADKAGIADVILESALSAIMDCEDSVAAVDAEDKILAYSNWLGLMKRDLTCNLSKNGKTLRR
ncbi:malate synthase G, partial [Amylibacter sp.]|nr:malate synthase G [Amylibacter sp.]